MNAIKKIQVEFGESPAPLEIPVRPVAATASHLRGVEVMVSRTEPGSLAEEAGSNGRSVEADRFITRIREVLRKSGAQ